MRRAGDELELGDVDKSTAITLNAGRIGEDELRLVAGDFDGAVQQAGGNALDFVEDDGCAATD